MDWITRRKHLFFWLGVVALASLSVPGRAASQSVVDVYQRQRLVRHAERALAEQGGRFAAIPPQFLPAPLDSILARIQKPGNDAAEPARPQLLFRRWQRVPKLGQAWFRKQFSDHSWVFVGNSQVSPLDTMMTRDLRSRLEAHFGKPTRTLGDFESRAGVSEGAIFEFEYWFVLNDSIPLVITDVNGPFERGIVASTTVENGDRLLEIRDTFLRPVVESDRRDSYVDYYYDDEELQWYRVGFDGIAFFVEPVSRPGMNRPVLSRPRDSDGN